MVLSANKLLVFLAAALAAARLPAAPVPAEVVSLESLKVAGVTCRRVTLQALTSSIEIDVLVDVTRVAGKYEGAECVVLKEPVPLEKLPAADAAAAADAGLVARRARSTKLSPAFLVLGRELSRAYLALEFSIPTDAGGAATRRFLVPVSAIGERRPAPPPVDAEGGQLGP
ncbi:MAG TPA: hypothetical protein VMD31_13370 [Opitutaceae bacterium]|nr:hypothetical protein [Opitutaceae bacterium]